MGERPIDKVCYFNRNRMIRALKRLLDAGEENIVVRFGASPDGQTETPPVGDEDLIILTSWEAEAVVEWLSGK